MPLLDTKMSTASGDEDGGALQVAVVCASTVPFVVVSPNLHVNELPARKFAPVTVTSVLPVAGPECGDMLLTAGFGMYWKSALLEKSTPLSVTKTSTSLTPLSAGGDTHVTERGVTKVAEVS